MSMSAIELSQNPLIMMLLFLRPLGAFTIFPLLSSRMLGGMLIRNSLILMCLLPAFPALTSDVSPFVKPDISVAFIGKEIFVGMFIGFIAAIPFWALDSAGYLIDTIRGSSLSSVLNPVLGEAASVVGILLTQIYATLFFLNDGFLLFLDALYDSYSLLPPGQGGDLGHAWLTLFLNQWNLLSNLAVKFVLPSITIMLLTDISLGLINRSAQQLNVFFLAMPLKSLSVFFILIISVASSIGVLLVTQNDNFRGLRSIMQAMSYE